MADLLPRALAVLFAIYAAIAIMPQIWRGVLHVGEQKPLVMLDRKERPHAFWTFVAFFYTVLGLMIAGAAFLPSS